MDPATAASTSWSVVGQLRRVLLQLFGFAIEPVRDLFELPAVGLYRKVLSEPSVRAACSRVCFARSSYPPWAQRYYHPVLCDT
jgi:hypothetical protein